MLDDPDFLRLLDDDLRSEQDGTADEGLTRDEFERRYEDILHPRPE